MKSLTFFNNKGGVGKTTLACNLASYMARELKKRILLVDCDPQCNSTQLLLDEEQWEYLYDDIEIAPSRTVLKVLDYIRAGDSGIDTTVDVQTSERFGFDVLAGHPGLAAFEDRLSASWVEFLGGDLGGARRSCWVAGLVDAADYDLVVFDLGPSLGALNRSVLIGSDRFVTPMAADLFSLYALDNISSWFQSWIREYARGVSALQENRPGDLERYRIPEKPRVSKGFAGYTIQQYVTKTSAGSTRPTAAYDRYKKQVPERAKRLTELQAASVADANLGTVPYMFSMVQLAQAAHSPIRELTTSDGVRGAQVSQKLRYIKQLDELSQRLVANLGVSSAESVEL